MSATDFIDKYWRPIKENPKLVTIEFIIAVGLCFVFFNWYFSNQIDNQKNLYENRIANLNETIKTYESRIAADKPSKLTIDEIRKISDRDIKNLREVAKKFNLQESETLAHLISTDSSRFSEYIKEYDRLRADQATEYNTLYINETGLISELLNRLPKVENNMPALRHDPGVQNYGDMVNNLADYIQLLTKQLIGLK